MTRESSLITHVEPLTSIDTGGFLLTERVHPQNGTLSSHSHESTILGIVLNGSCNETIGRHSQECAPYSLRALPAGESHTLEFGNANVRCLTIEIRPQALEGIRRFSKVVDQPFHARNATLWALILALYKELRLAGNTSLLTIEGLILEVLGDATRKPERGISSKQPLWLRQAKEIICDSAKTNVSLINVATLVGVHPTYLARMFRRYYRCSVGEYVLRLRLDSAIRELTESDKSLAEIAAATGFYDQSHFTHTFRLHLRMTPSEFRTAAKASNINTSRLRFSNNP
jgi:AraC family transcriptional regulator